MSVKSPITTEVITEAQRQIRICNACRYCEGYCSVFPAINRQRQFATGDIIQLANLCHNCQGCYHACQYIEPHEFKINLPQSLANVRVESWQTHSIPSFFAIRFQQSGVAIAAILVIAIALFIITLQNLNTTDGNGFYAYMSHSMMVLMFTPLFIAPLIIIAAMLKRYWQTINGKPIRLTHVQQAISSAATMKNLSGGQGQGCNYEAGDRFTNKRRWFHQATMFGFLLCFASTATATILHYVFQLPAPYPLLSLPKLLGLPGGILLVIGCAGLAWLKVKANPDLGATSVRGGEMAFILLLGLTGATGLLLYFATGTSLVPVLLAIHLGTVLSLFILMPYSKMVHGFFRLAALIHDAQQKAR